MLLRLVEVEPLTVLLVLFMEPPCAAVVAARPRGIPCRVVESHCQLRFIRAVRHHPQPLGKTMIVRTMAP
ncbi:hypothetical protein ASE08_00785 [Rhizobacter sp. Root16D2]|nr:hypothetical protein ASE08_00785 [Rhizobacter sp. Root16D2]